MFILEHKLEDTVKKMKIINKCIKLNFSKKYFLESCF